MDHNSEIHLAINRALGADLPVYNEQLWLSALVDYINRLILTDMNKLVHILYRFDIDENRLKTLLAQQAQTDAALLIAGMLIERQQDKAMSRNQFKKGSNPDIPDDEKW